MTQGLMLQSRERQTDSLPHSLKQFYPQPLQDTKKQFSFCFSAWALLQLRTDVVASSECDDLLLQSCCVHLNLKSQDSWRFIGRRRTVETVIAQQQTQHTASTIRRMCAVRVS